MVLVRKHCAHARIERAPFGGFGLVEEMTGLPIGMHTVACEHAAKGPSFVAAEFLQVALSFYTNNCKGCPHRVLVGIPNLATVAAEFESTNRAREETRDRARREEESARIARHRERERLVMNDPKTAQELIQWVNLLDAEEPNAAAGESLTATIQAAPHFVTPVAARVLLEAASALRQEPLLKAVRLAAGAGRVETEEALRIAIDVLARDPVIEAARIVLDRQPITADQIAPCRETLIMMAGRWRGPFVDLGRQSALKEAASVWSRAFAVLVKVDLVGVLTTIESLLASGSDYNRERAAAAAEVLVGLIPEVIPVLSQQLVASVGRSGGTDDFEPEDDAVHAITTALGRCIEINPQAASHSIESGARTLPEGNRRPLFRAYDNVIRHRPSGQQVPPETGAVVVDACLRRIRGDWGEDARRSAYDTLELISRWQRELLDGQAAALFGVLLDEIGQRASPPPKEAPGPIEEMERTTRNIMRRGHIRNICEMIGNVAARRTREVFDLLMPFLGSDSPSTDDTREMYVCCVGLLSSIGSRSEFLAEVAPLLYSAIVHTDQLVRASAVEALATLARAHRETELPSEFSATFPALLSDPYVVVHSAAVRVLARGFKIRDEHREAVISSCLNIARVYAASGQDSTTLDQALTALFNLTRSLPESSHKVAMDRVIARLASKLDSYDLRRFLEDHRRFMLDIPEYAETLIGALQDPQVVLAPNDRASDLREILHEIPVPLLLPYADALHHAAMVNMPRHSWRALEYVEVLQRLSLWVEAVGLAERISDALPKSVEADVPRTHAEQVLTAARLEAEVAKGATDLDQLVAESLRAAVTHQRARESAKTDLPWLT